MIDRGPFKRDCILVYDGVRLDFRRFLRCGLVPRRAQIPGQRMEIVPRKGLAKETTSLAVGCYDPSIIIPSIPLRLGAGWLVIVSKCRFSLSAFLLITFRVKKKFN